MKMIHRPVRCIAISCVVLFGVIGGFNSLIYAQDAVDAQSTTASTDVGAQSLDPGDSAPPPLPTEDTSGVSLTSGLAEPSETVATADPEPLTPAEGVALGWPPDGPIHSVAPGENVAGSRVFHYGLSLDLRGVYDDNINLTPNSAAFLDKVSGYYFAIEPAIALGFGDVLTRQANYIRLDYAPSVLFFADDAARDAVQHVIRLEGQYRMSRLTLQLTQDVQILNDTNINSTTGPGDIVNTVNLDVAGRTQVDVYRTHLGFSYDLTAKTFLSGSLEYSIYDYGSLISSERIMGNLFINYRYSPKLVIGIGGGAGYQWVESPSPDQTFEQANVRVTYQATGKISLYASVGVDFHQFDDSSADPRGVSPIAVGTTDTYVTPVYELGATYQPFDGTQITLRGNRRVSSSAVLAGQDFVLTNIIVAVRQRLFQRVYLGLTGAYENGEYFSTVSGVNATREDNYYLISPTIDVQLNKHWSVGAYFLHRENSSSLNNFAFDSNQVGVQTKITF
jgi:hypothetical protein